MNSPRLIQVSLLIGFVSLLTWAIFCIQFDRRNPSGLEAYGGPTLAGCHEPCDDTKTEELDECLHLWDETLNLPKVNCETYDCMHNIFRLLKCYECESENALPGACEYNIDENDWVRWVEDREMNHCSQHTRAGFDMDDCSITCVHAPFLVHKVRTPCQMPCQFGPPKRSRANVMYRPVCKGN